MNPRIRILLVDDEPQIIVAVTRVLRARRAHWEVRTARSARTALAMLESEPADIVVSDMRMAGMDGAEFLALVKHAYPAAIRIILSGEGPQESAERVRLVTEHVLAKPITSTSLIQVLEDAVNALTERATHGDVVSAEVHHAD